MDREILDSLGCMGHRGYYPLVQVNYLFYNTPDYAQGGIASGQNNKVF